MKKLIRRLGRTGFLILCFIPFGVWGLYYHGLAGLLAAMFGWWLGGVIYYRKENKRRLKRFLRRLSDLQLQLLVKGTICLPIVAAGVCYNGWLGLVASLLGIAVGEFICRKWLFKKR